MYVSKLRNAKQFPGTSSSRLSRFLSLSLSPSVRQAGSGSWQKVRKHRASTQGIYEATQVVSETKAEPQRKCDWEEQSASEIVWHRKKTVPPRIVTR